MNEIWIIKSEMEDNPRLTMGRDNAYEVALRLVQKNPDDIKSLTELKSSYNQSTDGSFGVRGFLQVHKLNQSEWRGIMHEINARINNGT